MPIRTATLGDMHALLDLSCMTQDNTPPLLRGGPIFVVTPQRFYLVRNGTFFGQQLLMGSFRRQPPLLGTDITLFSLWSTCLSFERSVPGRVSSCVVNGGHNGTDGG